MAKEELNRAQRRQRERRVKAHTPSFWDSNVNRVVVIVLAAAFLGVIAYGISGAGNKPPATAANKPATPAPAATPPAPQPTPQPTPAATPPATNAKVTNKDTKVGTGDVAKDGDTVTVNYVGTLDNGHEFDNSIKKGQPLTFGVGKPGIIQGFSDGVRGMKVGGKRSVTVPAELGYGPNGKGDIPPNATLHFELELLKVEPAK